MPISSPSTGRASTSPRSPAIRWAGTRRSPVAGAVSAEHGFRDRRCDGREQPGRRARRAGPAHPRRRGLARRCRACASTCWPWSRRSMPGPDHALYPSRSTSAACWSSPATRPGSTPCSPKRRRRPAREPLRLVNHGPFHTPADAGLLGPRAGSLPADWFGAPDAADDRRPRPYLAPVRERRRRRCGATPSPPRSSNPTISPAPSRSRSREYAPDRIILLGPGDTLGGAIAQALIAIEWRGLRSKADFQEMQASPIRSCSPWAARTSARW